MALHPLVIFCRHWVLLLSYMEYSVKVNIGGVILMFMYCCLTKIGRMGSVPYIRYKPGGELTFEAQQSTN